MGESKLKKVIFVNMTTTETPKHVHLGRNVKRLREILDIKQEVLAQRLGAEWNQQRISTIEGKDVIDAALLEELAKAMEVPVAAIKNFDDKAAAKYINTFCDSSVNTVINTENYITNSAEKLLEALEEIKKLNAALLKEKDEKIAVMQKMIEMLERK